MSSQEILVRPNQLRATSDKLQASATRIQEAIRRVDDLMRLPSHVLEGHQAANIRGRYQKRRDCLAGYQQRIRYFAEQLDRIAERLEAADQKLAGQKTGSGALSPDWMDIFEHFLKAGGTWSKEVLDFFSDFVKNRTDFKLDLKALGLQKYYEIFSKGILYRGRMDKFLKKTGNLFMALGVVMDTLRDMNEGTPFFEAAATNIINTLEVKGIAALHPYAALTMIINSGIQVVGQVSLGLQEMNVDVISRDQRTHDLLMDGVNDMEQGLDKMDLENATKELARTGYKVYLEDYVDVGTKTATGIWDWATKDGSWQGLGKTMESLVQYTQERLPLSEVLMRQSPLVYMTQAPYTGEGLQKTGQALVNVVDGIWDTAVSSSTNTVMQKIVSETNKIRDIPWIPDEARNMIDDAVYQFIKPIRGTADFLVN